MLSLPLLVLLGAAGATGAVARYGVAEWVGPRWNGAFPLATLLINVTGAFALGLLMTAGLGHAAHATTRLLLGTGFLGGYTTFSTLSFETHALARGGKHPHAWLNAVGTLLAGALAAGLGIALGRVI